MKTKDIYFYMVGIVVIVGFLCLSSFIILKVVPADNKDMIRDVLATLRDGIMIILGYWYGSSKGSADKNEILAKGDNTNQ